MEEQSKSIRDLPFLAAINLTAAVALSRINQPSLAARRFLTCDRLEVTSNRELQPQYYYAAGMAIGAKNTALMDLMRNRALRIWSEQGVVSVQMEMEDPSNDLQDSDARDRPG